MVNNLSHGDTVNKRVGNLLTHYLWRYKR